MSLFKGVAGTQAGVNNVIKNSVITVISQSVTPGNGTVPNGGKQPFPEFVGTDISLTQNSSVESFNTLLVKEASTNQTTKISKSSNSAQVEIVNLSPSNSGSQTAVVIPHADAGGGIQNPPPALPRVPFPAITSLSRANGPAAGGTMLSIMGSGFTGATAVTIGGTPVSALTVVGDTQINVTSPVGTGVANVVVTAPGGVATATGVYTYFPVPTVDAVTPVSPTRGPAAGGTRLTIKGTGLTGVTAVTVGGRAASALVVDSDTQIKVTSPLGTGVANVVVTTPGGNANSAGAFTYVSIASVAPNTGLATGGTVVTLTGTGFTGATSVTLDGIPGTSLTFVNDTKITVVTPMSINPLPIDVVVSTPAGSATSSAAYTYLPPPPGPGIAGLLPNVGTSTGGDTILIGGIGFTGATAVTFDGIAVASFTVINDTQIRVVTPARIAGPGLVTVVVTALSGSLISPIPFVYGP